MDIVTHAAMGIVLAAPFVESHPAAAACFVFGAVLPDLDALSRVFGKRAFLRWHQTYTHALPVIAVLAAVAWPALRIAGVTDPWAAPALGVGMTLHALLDVTNTYGITILAPLSMRRRCLEWVFFIDAFLLSVTAVAVAAVSHALLAGGSTNKLVVAYAASLVAYWTAKAVLRHRAARLAPDGTLALVPSALVPWRFLGCARSGDQVTTFTMNAVNGHRTDKVRHTVLDGSVAKAVGALPEFRAMRDLSTAYHVVNVTQGSDGTSLVCRDLRIRNFGGRFGTLTVRVDRNGVVARSRFVSRGPAPTHGFRFSRIDAVVLLAGAGLTWALWRHVGQFALLVPATLFHFFLFCNVFRVRRGAELLWAGAFVVNFAAWVPSGAFSWSGVLGTQLPVTMAILVVEVRHPRYHGVFSRVRTEATTKGDQVGR